MQDERNAPSEDKAETLPEEPTNLAAEDSDDEVEAHLHRPHSPVERHMPHDPSE